MASVPMPCIICAASTVQKDRGGTWSTQYLAVVRTRTCTANPDHKFETLEQPATAEILDRAEVVTGSDSAPFSMAALSNDVDYAVGHGLSEGQRKAFNRRAFRQIVLSQRGPRQQDLPRGVTMRVNATDIRDIVGATFATEAADRTKKESYRRDHRRAHMLYGFARGADGSALPDAPAALNWLRERYGDVVDPKGVGYEVRRHYADVREDHWHPLRSDAAPEPTHVVFLKHISGPAARPPIAVVTGSSGSAARSARNTSRESLNEFDGTGIQRVSLVHTRVPYDRVRLETSIRHAMAGAHDHSRISRLVLQWVLWSLAGQSVVRQADLASQVTQCLRRVNEVAYLRWVILVRDLDVDDVWAEALGLLAWPSPRLVFEPVPEHDPQRTHHVMPTPDPAQVEALPSWG